MAGIQDLRMSHEFLLVMSVVVLGLSSAVVARGEHTIFSKQQLQEDFEEKSAPATFGTLTGQQYLELSFYLHDNLDTRPSASAVTVVPALTSVNGNGNPHYFGAIAVFDDAMTESPDVQSKSLGRGRGFYVFNAMSDNGASLEFIWTAVFNDASGYGGSTVSFKGYDKIDDPEREIAITGGTGKFRLARGWATIKTISANGGAANLFIVCHIFYGA